MRRWRWHIVHWSGMHVLATEIPKVRKEPPKKTTSWSTANIMLRGFKQSSLLNLKSKPNHYLISFPVPDFFSVFPGLSMAIFPPHPVRCITFSSLACCSDLGIISKWFVMLAPSPLFCWIQFAMTNAPLQLAMVKCSCSSEGEN